MHAPLTIAVLVAITAQGTDPLGSHNDRAFRVETALAQFIGARAAEDQHLGRELVDDARILALGATIARDEDSEGLVSPRQAVRAVAAVSSAPADKRVAIDELLARAESDAERAVILKEFAAHDDVSAAAAVADAVRGQAPSWIAEHTTAYGLSSAGGVRQTFKDSCMAAIKIVAEAEQDPLVALRLRADAHAVVDDEREQLEAAGGIAALRDDAHARGRGTADHTLLLALGDDLAAHTHVIAGISRGDLPRIEALLDDGIDVPLRIATASGAVAHSVILVDARRSDDGAREFRVHDPWTGRSSWINDDDLVGFGLVPTEQGERRHVTHVYLYEP